MASERNRKGFLLKIGNRKGRRHYRVYTAHKKNSLIFEAEMKGDLIKDFHDLLVACFRKDNGKFISFWKMDKPGQIDEFLNNNNVI